MRVLVTGATGFVGSHVTRELEEAGHEVIRHAFPAPEETAPWPIHAVDVRDRSALDRLAAEVSPEACVHLGGIAFVPMGWKDPRLVFEVNTLGTINLLEALRGAGCKGPFLFASSCEVYGRSSEETVVTETSPLAPVNPYAGAKMAADVTALMYADRYGMHTMTARPQNHIGPGQAPYFVISSFARQLTDIAAGRAEPLMRVGNLASSRDFLDVRDVARAYRLLLEQGEAGEAYNVASFTPIAIGEVLEILSEIVQVRPTIEVDPELFRPTDRSLPLSADKLRAATGWQPAIPLTQTLRDIVSSLN